MQSEKGRGAPLVGRDPVAAIVEERLREFARDQGVDLRVQSDRKGNVVMTFEALSVHGESQDIAALRLACSVLDDSRFAKPLTRALGRLSELSASQSGRGATN